MLIMEVFWSDFDIFFIIVHYMTWHFLFKFDAVKKYNGALMFVKHIWSVCQNVVIMDVVCLILTFFYHSA